MSTSKYDARLTTVSQYDEVLEATKKDRTENATNDKHKQTDVDKRITEIEIPKFDDKGNLIGGEVWEIEISVLNDENMAYDISRLRNITKDAHSELRDMLKANPNIDRASLPQIISQRGNFVKSNSYNSFNETQNDSDVKYSVKKNDATTDVNIEDVSIAGTTENTVEDAKREWAEKGTETLFLKLHF